MSASPRPPSPTAETQNNGLEAAHAGGERREEAEARRGEDAAHVAARALHGARRRVPRGRRPRLRRHHLVRRHRRHSQAMRRGNVRGESEGRDERKKKRGAEGVPPCTKVDRSFGPRNPRGGGRGRGGHPTRKTPVGQGSQNFLIKKRDRVLRTVLFVDIILCLDCTRESQENCI